MLSKGGCAFRFVYPSGGWGQHKYQCNLMPHPSWSKIPRQEFLTSGITRGLANAWWRCY
jgi:hypothetical protein